MSLDNPNIIEKAIAAAKAFTHWRLVGVLAGILVIVGFTLFVVDACGDWSFKRKQDKLKANVNAALANIAEREKTIANLKQQQAAEVETVNRATQEYLDAVGVSDATRADTNKALANMANVARSEGNVSVEELKEKLRGL